MGKMSRFLRICAVLSAMFFATNVFAAGYTCNDIKMYTSCNPGYYMTVDGTPNTTAQVGNACTLCEVGYYCPGGDATTYKNARVACTAGSACTTTGLSAPDATCTAGYYCPSGSSSPTASACPTNWTSDAGAKSSKYCYRTATLYKGLSSRGLASGTLTTPTAGSTYYRATVTSDTGGTAAATLRVYYGYNYFPVTTGLTSPTGYTVTGGVGTSLTCTTTTSSTVYSSYLNVTSTADTAPTFYVCMKANEYTCAAGQYLTTSATCATCTVGYYCPTEEVTYTYNNAIQGRTACSTIATGWMSLAGAAGINQCFYPISLNKNGFSGTLTAGTGTGCKVATTATGTTNVALRLYYNTACTLPTFSGYTQDGYTDSAAWSASDTIAGTPVTTIAATTTTPTIKTYYVQKPSCAQNYYKSDTTTCSACGSNSSTSAANVATTCACTFGYSDDGTVGGETSATGGCSLINDISCSAGYYLPKNTLTCNGTCTAGNWCAGGTFSFNASSNQGLSSCSGNLGTGYTSVGGTGDTANTKCYLPVSAGYIRSGTSGTTTAACDAGKYKTAHNAYYGSSYSCSNVTAGYWNNGGGTNATGGVISGKSGGTIAAGRWGAAGATSDQGSGAVSAGYYSTGGGTSATPTAAGNGCLSSKACGKVTAGCYTTSTGSTSACPNECPGDMTSDAGSDAKTDCKITCTAGNYLAANTGVCATCTKGNYCANDGTYNFNASSNQGIAACSGANQWQASTGKTSCDTVTDGMYKSNNYTLQNCGTGSYCKSGVKTACPNSGTTSSETASLITSCYKTGLSLTVSNGAGTQRCFYTSGSGTSAVYDTSCDTKTVTKCNAKYYRANASDLTCTTVGTGHYSPADSLGRTQCPTADSGWTVTSPAGTTYSDCYETKTGSAISSYCNAGVLKRTASSASAYNTTATISTALTAIAGAYVNGQTCTYCPAGKYQATNGSTATSCSSSVNKGYYNTGCGTSATGGVCNTTNFSGGKVNAGCYADTTGSTSACPKSCSSLGGGLYKNSAAGSDAETDCYFATTAGNYMVAATDTAQTKCPIKQYCESETLYYPNVSVLNDGGWNDCPAVDGRILTTYPDDWYSPTSVTASLQPWSTGLKSKSACMANYTVTNPRGRFSIESVKYDEDADKYQNNLTGGKYYTKVNPGFYVLEQYSATRCDGTENANKTMIYKDAQPCPAGSYCPGYTSMPICSSGTYGTEMGKFSCSDNTSSNYPNSTAGSGNTAGATSVNSCYLTTTSGKFVKTANAAQETCTCGGYCPGSINVNYGNTGGKTDCTAGTYNDGTGSSASSVCKTTSAGYYALAGSCSQTQVNANCWGGAGSKVACPNSCTSPYSTSAKGSDDANDCYLTTTAKNYVKTAGAGQTTCAAGTYCPGGSVIYKGGTVSGRNTTGGSTTCPAGSFCAAGVSAGTECVLGSYSAAGASTCTACQDGKTTSAKGATSCNATCSNASGVSDWETASWATTNAMTNLCTIAASAGCSANYYKNNNACSTCSSGTGSKYTFSAAGTTSVNSCYLKTSTGKYVATKGAGETACISPYYCPGGTTVYYGTGTTTGGNSPCTGIASIYNASDAGASKQSQCFAKTSPGKYIRATGTSETTCPAGDYCLGGTTVYYGSAGGNKDCPSGYTNGTTGYSLESQCLMSVAAGKYVATAKESVASGTCEAGYAKPVHTVNYGGTSSCNKCTGATYQPDTGQSSCLTCPTYEAYSSKVLGQQYWTSSGVHDTKEGCQVRMNEPVADDTGDYDGKVYCSYSNTAGDYSSCWVYQQANSCIDGYYYAAGVGNNTYGSATTLEGKVCKPVESGYWSPADELTRTACATGLVTCGAGKCANEAADCGRILHAGNQSIYLRSAARTSPALNVKIGNQTFFGALSTSYSSALKVKNDGTTYSVVNDYQ